MKIFKIYMHTEYFKLVEPPRLGGETSPVIEIKKLWCRKIWRLYYEDGTIHDMYGMPSDVWKNKK